MTYRCNPERVSVTSNKIRGLAAPYERLSRDLGGFKEVIQRGAFESVLQSNPNVFAVLDHSREAHKVLGSTHAGTLQLRSTDEGLEFELEVPDTQVGKDVITLVSRGDLSKMSFAFSLERGQDSWNTIRGEMIRTLKGFKGLHDVSIVSEPAYPDTRINK